MATIKKGSKLTPEQYRKLHGPAAIKKRVEAMRKTRAAKAKAAKKAIKANGKGVDMPLHAIPDSLTPRKSKSHKKQRQGVTGTEQSFDITFRITVAPVVVRGAR